MNRMPRQDSNEIEIQRKQRHWQTRCHLPRVVVAAVLQKAKNVERFELNRREQCS